MKLSIKYTFVLLSVKNLLNHLEYLIREEDRPILDKFHEMCRDLCIIPKKKKS